MLEPVLATFFLALIFLLVAFLSERDSLRLLLCLLSLISCYILNTVAKIESSASDSAKVLNLNYYLLFAGIMFILFFIIIDIIRKTGSEK